MFRSPAAARAVRAARALRAAVVACIAAASLAAPAFAQGWSVDPDASTLNFFSLKNDEIVDQHEFNQLSGGVGADGAAVIDVSLASVSTGIEIRDQRMRDMLFDVANWPLARISTRVDPAEFEKLSPGQARQADAVLTVDAYGEIVDYRATLVVTRLAQDRVAVSTEEPIIVRAGDFGYRHGIDALREVAGLDSISSTVPVVFLVVLER